MREIPLTKGLVALVDDEDFEWLSQFKWHADHEGYACRKAAHPIKVGKSTTIFMHRELLGLEFGDSRKGDHKNGYRTDNRRENIRIATAGQNRSNSRLAANNTSGFKGVSWSKADKCWYAQIRIGGKRKYLGGFKAPEEAHAAYCKAAQELNGEFANFGEKKAA
ncbi:Fis family transcriptional regulator [Paraburkholderia sp. Tr-20389]|uniref:AP2 domain-containing protein n=1 Tax=Paraburkholderia sp. Tr-20389 TaxID=2703903 RepID=UPI0019802145|nr:AP2 domain-containing protein [Paraburkholderia sp. Tr-20389]MBN3757254.1 Fis family transcriptional regulator [Paraburkholderia sp. Tr-20389]